MEDAHRRKRRCRLCASLCVAAAASPWNRGHAQLPPPATKMFGSRVQRRPPRLELALCRSYLAVDPAEAFAARISIKHLWGWWGREGGEKARRQERFGAARLPTAQGEKVRWAAGRGKGGGGNGEKERREVGGGGQKEWWWGQFSCFDQTWSFDRHRLIHIVQITSNEFVDRMYCKFAKFFHLQCHLITWH
jgi:hypothetical protein